MMRFFDVATRKLAVLFGALCVLTLMVNCSSQTPESVAGNFVSAVANNRVDEAIGYFSLEDVKENDLTTVKGKCQMIVGEMYSEIQKDGGLDSLKSNLANNDKSDNTARVDVEMKFKNGKTKTERFTLVKESGKWKIKVY